METPALKKLNILVTDVGSYLGSKLAERFLSRGHIVFGTGSVNPPEEVLTNPSFTFLEIDLSQPIPHHFPQFDVVLNLVQEVSSIGTFNQFSSLSPVTSNIIKIAKEKPTKVIFVAPIESETQTFEHFWTNGNLPNLKLFLVGDVYGPEMVLLKGSTKDYFTSANKLSKLITQAVDSDKIILEKEGLEVIYPTYIDDALDSIEKFSVLADNKKIHFIVSQTHMRSLSAAYDIQSAARNVLSKELGLYFSGPKQEIEEKAQPIIRIPDLGYHPKVSFQEGLKNTFSYFQNQGKVKEVVNQQTEELPTKESKKIEEKKQEILDQKKTGIKKPKITNKFGLKKTLFILLLILILIALKTTTDIFWALRNINGAKADMLSGNFQGANEKASAAANSFKAAYNKVNLLSYPVKFIFPAKVEGINSTLLSAGDAAGALNSFAIATKTFSQDIKTIMSPQSQQATDYETPKANYAKAFELSAEAIALTANPALGPLNNQIKKANTSYQTLNNFSESALELVNFTESLTSQDGQKTYLVLLQNNTELRPGGGFIGNYGLIELANGKIQSISTDDIYNIDGQLKEKIDPPKQITEKLGTKQLYMRDSNWSTDFTINAATARDFFKKETGKTVDGVIGVDLSYIQSLLDKIGPIKLTDFNETITAQNLFEKGEYYSEVGFFPGSTQKKDFFGNLTAAVFQAISSKLSGEGSKTNPVPWTGILESTKDALSQKQILLSLDDSVLNSFIKSKGWNNPLPPLLFNPADDSQGTRDFLALSEANLGANKVNRFLERSVDYEMTIGKDADLVATLKITYKNNSQAETWPAGKYINYLRVYVPYSSSLFDYQNGDDKDLKNVGVSTQNNLTVFDTYVEVPIKSTKTISFSYRIPKNIKLEQAPTYILYVDKQPGTGKDHFEFHFNLPDYLMVKTLNGEVPQASNQNLDIKSDLSIDRQFQIELSKK